MSFNFEAKSLVIPEGKVMKIIDSNNNIIWQSTESFNYVSLGDSIAAGHSIDDDWEKYYGTRSQYGGENGNSSTIIVPKSYTDLISKSGYMGNTISFARSGDTVRDLINKLDNNKVISALKGADYVTICIGANDVLQPAMLNLEEYINSGDTTKITNTANTNLANLGNPNHLYSYHKLFTKLQNINPNAKYIFTTIYNPYKYLWLDEGEGGFFSPIVAWWNFLNITIIDTWYFNLLTWRNEHFVLTLNMGDYLQDLFFSAPLVKTLFSRVNGLNSYSDNLVKQLNTTLNNAIKSFPNNNNFLLVDTYTKFNEYPDRDQGPMCYNDLVNVEFTSGYDTSKMDWGALWRNDYGDDGWQAYWKDLFLKYLSINTSAFPSTNVYDYISFNTNGYATELVTSVIEKVIVPNVDPHPEEAGHAVMRDVFLTQIPHK